MNNDKFLILFNVLILLIMPFITLGIIKKTKAFWSGRKGVSILQPLYDTIKLFKKDKTISSTTSWIFNFAPAVIFTTTLFAGLFTPMIKCHSIIDVAGAFIIFSYILGLGKFFALIAAMDTGSSFEGMGASREASFTTIVEPAFFIILASLTALSGNYTFAALTDLISSNGTFGILIIIMAVVSLFIMLLVECSRVPVDDPTTHLELTMIHEVMILDNSGADLALITWANGIKIVILMALISNIIIPLNLDFNLSLILFILMFPILGIIVGTIESGIARLRMSHVFEFVFVMSSFALVVASLAAVKMYGI